MLFEITTQHIRQDRETILPILSSRYLHQDAVKGGDLLDAGVARFTGQFKDTVEKAGTLLCSDSVVVRPACNILSERGVEGGLCAVALKNQRALLREAEARQTAVTFP